MYNSLTKEDMFISHYQFDDYELMTPVPLKKGGGYVDMLRIKPQYGRKLEDLLVITGRYLPADATKTKQIEGSGGESTYIDYYSPSLQAELVYEPASISDGTLRLVCDRPSPNASIYTWVRMGLGTNWF